MNIENVRVYWGPKDNSLPFFITDKPMYNHSYAHVRGACSDKWKAQTTKQQIAEVLACGYLAMDEGANLEQIQEQVKKITDVSAYSLI